MNKNTQNFVPVKGYPNYSISDYGMLKTEDRWVENRHNIVKGKIKAKWICTRGYVHYGLCIDGKQKRIMAHRLVAVAFIPNPNNYPEVNHINGIKDDNYKGNLEWCTHRMNTDHAMKMGLNPKGSKNGFSKMTEELVFEMRKVHKSGVSIAEIHRRYPVTAYWTTRKAVLGIYWKHVPMPD